MMARRRAQIEQSRVIEAQVAALDTTFRVEAWDCDASLRSLLLHVMHDYARHNRHADLLREAIDGTVGA